MTQRWLELLILFLVPPFVLAVFLPPSAIYPVLIGGGVLGAILLHITNGFQWRQLWQGPIRWAWVLWVSLATLAVSLLLCWWILPDRVLFLPLNVPHFLPVLAVGYTFILALPQEIIYRALFFERYGHLFPDERIAILVNAAIFSFGHLMYWHWVVMVMTFFGGIIFAWCYLRGSFKEAWLVHAGAGLMVFFSGLGWLFYHGGNLAQGQ